MTALARAAAEIASLRAVIAEAREALEPFAREAVTWADALPDDNRMRMASGEEYPAYAAFTMGALRCARAALARIAALDVPAHPSCCNCGKRDLSTVEGDGGAECELSDGRWVCSPECYDAALDGPDQQEELCEDEGCPHYGTPHVCITRVETECAPSRRPTDE